MSIAIKNEFCSVVLPAVLALAALLLSLYAALGCSFVQFVIPPATYSHERAGLWGYKWWNRKAHAYTCLAYPEDLAVDGMWRAARGFSSLTLALGGLAVANSLLAAFGAACRRCCCKRSSSVRIKLRFCKATSKAISRNESNLYLACSLGSSLSLLFVRGNACQHNTIFDLMRDHVCKLSTGAICTYVAMGLWFVAASLAMFREEREDTEGGEARNSNGVENATVPLIQDVVFECEQSVYSNRSGRSGPSVQSSRSINTRAARSG